MHLFTRVSLSVKMNMFGYDDDDLNKVSSTSIRRSSKDLATAHALVPG